MPRLYIIRSTHGGVKWKNSLGGDETKIEELKPGLIWYWPLVSEIQSIVTARRPVDIPTMSILTKDGRSIIISAAVVFRINNVTLALGERNWDVDSTLVDIAQAAIFDEVRSTSFEELLNGTDQLLDTVTTTCKTEMKKFGVLVEKILAKDFDKSKTYRQLGDAASFITEEDEEE